MSRKRSNPHRFLPGEKKAPDAAPARTPLSMLPRTRCRNTRNNTPGHVDDGRTTSPRAHWIIIGLVAFISVSGCYWGMRYDRPTALRRQRCSIPMSDSPPAVKRRIHSTTQPVGCQICHQGGLLTQAAEAAKSDPSPGLDVLQGCRYCVSRRLCCPRVSFKTSPHHRPFS